MTEMDNAISRAEKKLEYLSSDEEALVLYRAREASAHERANLLYTGRMEGKLEVAKNMLSENMSHAASHSSGQVGVATKRFANVRNGTFI